VNYLREINAFYDWLETNSLSDSAISLWHALMHINNRAGWIPEFAVAISTLTAKTGLKKDAIIRARLRLQQLGRVDFRSRSGQQSTVYKIIPFESEYQTQTTTQDTCVGLNDTNHYTNQEQTTTQPATERTTQTTSIIKQNNTRQNEINNDISIQLSLNITKLINDFSLTCRGISDIEKLKSFIGHMESDLIFEAFKRSEKKSVAYMLRILTNWDRGRIYNFDMLKKSESRLRSKSHNILVKMDKLPDSVQRQMEREKQGLSRAVGVKQTVMDDPELRELLENVRNKKLRKN